MRIGESVMPSLTDRLKIASPSLFVGFGIGFVGLLYFSQGSGNNYESRIADVKTKLTISQKKLKETVEITSNKQKFQGEMERVSQTFRLALEYLPKELDIQDLLKKIYSEARSAGVELTHFVPKQAVAKDFYDEIPMEIEVAGTFSQLVLFLANVGKLPRIINVLNVELGTPILVDGSPMLKMKGILVAYRYKESTK
jgi:type IV pilus assembly protein PilO